MSLVSHRPLGSTGLRVSEVGFGGWQLGGRGWGTFRVDEARRAIARALQLGVNLFDTAGVYGFGRSEELLANALRGAPPGTVVVTKGGLVWDDRGRVRHDNRPESLARQIEDSSRRLRRDPLDVFLLHWPDPQVPVLESVGALQDFQRTGRIRAWGLSNFSVADVLRVDASLREAGDSACGGAGSLPAAGGDSYRTGDSPLPAGAPSSASRRLPSVAVLSYPVNALGEYADEHLDAGVAGRELLDRPSAGGWGFLAFDVLCRGLLAGRHAIGTRFGKRDVRSRDRRFLNPLRSACIERARRLADLAGELGVPPAAVAVRAVLDRAGVTSAIVGMRTPLQVDECAAASTLPAGKVVGCGIDP